jgi:hypothetical protein
MSAYPQPQEPTIKVSVLLHAGMPVVEPGIAPVTADYYPRRRRRPTMTAQRSAFDEFLETSIRHIR